MLNLIDSNENTAIHLVITSLFDRKVVVDAIVGGITIRADFPDSPPCVEHYQKPMGLAMAYRFKYLEDLLYPTRAQSLAA